MSKNIEKTPKSKITRDHRILAKNSLYSFLNSYGSFFFSLITSFLLARLILQRKARLKSGITPFHPSESYPEYPFKELSTLKM